MPLKIVPKPKTYKSPIDGNRKARLLRDTIGKIEKRNVSAEKVMMGDTDLALLLDDETAEAHNLYLFGRNGRKPVKDLEKLAKMTDVPIDRLKILAPAWRKEAMRLARESSPLFAMAATTKAREAHFKDLDSMRKRIDEFEAAMPEVTSKEFPPKQKLLMEMRREWQDAAGVSAAIEISKTCMIMEAKAMLAAPPKEGDEEGEDLSAFDVDGEIMD